MDLFSGMREGHRAKARPLAARMRPRTLDEFVGQDHFLGPGKLLRRAWGVAVQFEEDVVKGPHPDEVPAFFRVHRALAAALDRVAPGQGFVA